MRIIVKRIAKRIMKRMLKGIMKIIRNRRAIKSDEKRGNL